MLTVPKGPQRIVCLTEEPTEILYALGEEARIVGISAYTTRPPIAKATKPIVSAFINGSVSKICALKPDLVIGFSDIQAELAKALIAKNLNVLIFNQRSISEILSVIDHIGAIVHKSTTANTLIESYLGRLAGLREKTAQWATKPRVYFEEWDVPTITAIEWVGELIEIAGGENIFSTLSKGKLAKARVVSTQQIIDNKPEVVFASWCGKPFNLIAFKNRFAPNSFPALANGAIHEVPSDIILQPGPAALTDGVEMLHRILETHRETHFF